MNSEKDNKKIAEANVSAKLNQNKFFNFDFKTNKQVKLFNRIWNYLALLGIAGFLALDLYLIITILTDGSFDRTWREFAQTLGVIGIIFSFVPLGGLIFKYSLIFLNKTKFKDSNWARGTSVVLGTFLFWERKTRLASAWFAIMVLIAHFVIYSTRLNNNPSLGLIVGIVAIALLILMNLVGILMFGLRLKKVWLDKLKYFGYCNLVLGLTFFGLTLTHILII